MRPLLPCLLLAACAPDLRDDYPFDGALPAGNYLTHEQQGNLTLSTIDATHKDSYVYVDLDTAAVVTVADGWDLSFQRFKISANGGSGGPGPVRVAVVRDGDFDALAKAPADGYQRDGADTVFNGAEGGWYAYDLGAHKVVTRDDLFYVVATDQAFFKLKMVSYYDEHGTAARMKFSWGRILTP